MRGLLARRGAGACSLWAALRDGFLLAGRALGRACGQPCATAAGWSRRVRAAARRSGRCRAWGSVSRALGPKKMSAALSRRSLCPAPPRPAGGASFVRVRGVARAPRDLPERAASRIRALLRPPPPPHREARLSRSATQSKRRVTAGRSARQQGLPQTRLSHRHITAGCASRRRWSATPAGKQPPTPAPNPRPRPSPKPAHKPKVGTNSDQDKHHNCRGKPWVRSSRPSPPPRRSPSRECPARSTTNATGRRRRAASRRRARRRAPRSKMWK